MDLTAIEHNGIRVMEGAADRSQMTSASEINLVIEACFSKGARRVLLYSSNVPPAFFDLSSGNAGTILQKLRDYHIRFALVVDSRPPAFSSRFGEMVAEEKRGRDFGLFDSRDAALDWLATAG
jgi:hypothetical protein